MFAERCLPSVMTIVRSAGHFLVSRFRSGVETGSTDREAESLIIERLAEYFPEHGVLSEESGESKSQASFRWIVDPLDGTSNFLLGIPHFSISLALLHQDTPIMGVVYHPFLDLTYAALKGRGAWLNGKKLKPRRRRSLRPVTALILGYGAQESFISSLLTSFLMEKSARLLTNWAPSLDWCMLSEGLIDLLIAYQPGPFDLPAGMLIADEAGAIGMDWTGARCSMHSNHLVAAVDEGLLSDMQPHLLACLQSTTMTEKGAV